MFDYQSPSSLRHCVPQFHSRHQLSVTFPREHFDNAESVFKMSFGNSLCDAPWELWPSRATQRRVFRENLPFQTFKPEISELDDYFQDLEAAAEDWPKTKRIVLLDDRTETKANGEMKPYHKPLLVKKEHVKDSLSDYKLPEQHHS
jgi:hypothetical protein